MVVGETPYAEGFGDVGGPCGRTTACPAEMDALVASWLPGSQGEGVADVLFGARPFTGRLSMTWPRTLEQEPINVGDRDYHPCSPMAGACVPGSGEQLEVVGDAGVALARHLVVGEGHGQAGGQQHAAWPVSGP